ncbi:putative zinc finger/helix-turn-helix protein, YgiT family [Nocardia otitidiscaviarum]|uniref:Putative zinc finger/helix-turn-helix protein, YgiT family n=1 Tax=Nocardia otitidiscaviarum TaxID=1823 RepID=A0A379JKR9_9NOCA|nr:helix-turn-helix transcriptional regulator [Nocardia otitidiscaviarum]SUD49239.1 putative zinc finger/helix-turn-helix protein, YgiT family [Nocardia otitidiscaviarum]
MTDSVHQAREALGQRLREVRRHSGLTARQLASLAGWHESKLSRFERGSRSPSEADLRAICQYTGATDQLPDLIATLNNVDAAYVEWRRILSTGTKRRQHISVVLAEKATLTRIYQPTIIPGILQTAEYAEAILRDVVTFERIPDDVDEGVAKRLERQQFLYKGKRRFRIVIAEQALSTTVGDDAVMTGQLDRLFAVMGLPRVVFGIIPSRALPPLTAPNFIMFDDHLVMVEGISAEQTITQPTEVAVYSRAFETLAGKAVTGDEARTLIRKALDTRSGGV